ncbi:hypothetical protein [Dysgonomonas macrotermitis]|uniref:Uncharacterized protein n=1 Tax=Dysgonomonas macrotermitis TaxID=1346286 RepID=A0A1M5AG09_9BACT|nr:hypothetical protein [Dysgonomonas macrotermitis]SHF29169.1 hypothetical protein SAMN05444362_10539 [Dysgonomonas macrotermitis]
MSKKQMDASKRSQEQSRSQQEDCSTNIILVETHKAKNDGIVFNILYDPKEDQHIVAIGKNGLVYRKTKEDAKEAIEFRAYDLIIALYEVYNDLKNEAEQKL